MTFRRNRRASLDQEMLMAEVMTKVGGMVAMGMDRNTISFYLISEIGDAPGWSALDRMMFVGMVENALDNMGVR